VTRVKSLDNYIIHVDFVEPLNRNRNVEVATPPTLLAIIRGVFGRVASPVLGVNIADDQYLSGKEL